MNIIAWNNPRKKEKAKEGVGREREKKGKEERKKGVVYITATK